MGSLFRAGRSRKAVLNLDDPETRALSETVPGDKVIGYGFDSPGADFMGKDLQLQPDGVTFALEAEGERHDVRLAVPGRHNASNALAAIAATRALGIRLEDAVAALGRFEGLRRRLERVGEAGGVTVIDDFAHNPDKIAATLATLRAQPGRLLIMFQPHGYGPLAKMGEQLAASFAEGMAPDDRLYLPDPVYQGGTVERTRGSDWLAEEVRQAGKQAEHIAERPKIGPHREAMRGALAAALDVPVQAVSVKGKSNEGMGWIGRAEGLACMAVASLAPVTAR
jgi:UDP-N-acetylmuramate--alanine ligase